MGMGGGHLKQHFFPLSLAQVEIIGLKKVVFVPHQNKIFYCFLGCIYPVIAVPHKMPFFQSKVLRRFCAGCLKKGIFPHCHFDLSAWAVLADLPPKVHFFSVSGEKNPVSLWEIKGLAKTEQLFHQNIGWEMLSENLPFLWLRVFPFVFCFLVCTWMWKQCQTEQCRDVSCS